jgi:uncharacterized glyoxalase superfamily protein PhnB
MICACCNQAKPNTVTLNCRPDVSLCADCVDWLERRCRQPATASDRARVEAHDPTLRVSDMQQAAAHYQRLGFAIEYHDESYAFALRDDLTIHLTRDLTPGGTTIYLHVDDADRLADEWREAGASVSGVEDTDYGKHEGSHVDPDGNVIRFGSPASR